MAGTIPKELKTKEARRRLASGFRPPSSLPDVSDGTPLRWVRASLLGNSDPANVAKRRDEGWEPVIASENPKAMERLSLRPDQNVEVGGLILCRNSEEMIEARTAYYEEKAQRVQHMVDEQLATIDPRMPMLRPERRTKVFIRNR